MASAMLGKAGEWWKAKSPTARLYAVGGIVFGLGVLVLLFAPNSLLASWALTIAMFFLALGVIRECLAWAVRTKDHPILKLGVFLLGVIAAALAAGGGAVVLSRARLVRIQPLSKPRSH